MFNSLRSCALQPTELLCPRDFPGLIHITTNYGLYSSWHYLLDKFHLYSIPLCLLFSVIIQRKYTQVWIYKVKKKKASFSPKKVFNTEVQSNVYQSNCLCKSLHLDWLITKCSGNDHSPLMSQADSICKSQSCIIAFSGPLTSVSFQNISFNTTSLQTSWTLTGQILFCWAFSFRLVFLAESFSGYK